MDSFIKKAMQGASTPMGLNSEGTPVQNFAFGGIANPVQRPSLRGVDRAFLDARQKELDAFEQQRLAYNDALNKWQTEVYSPYKSQVDAYNAAAQKYNTEVYQPYEQQYQAYEKALNEWNAGPRTSAYAGPAAPTLASQFTMTAPGAPKAFDMQAPVLPFKEEDVQKFQQEAASRAQKDAGNRAVAIDVVSDPDRFNFGSMSVAHRFMAEGGPVDKEDDDGVYDEGAGQLIKDFQGYGYTPEEIQELVDKVAEAGRGGDELLAYLSPESMAFLKARGGSGTINPITGLPEFKGGVIGKIVSAVRRVFGGGSSAAEKPADSKTRLAGEPSDAVSTADTATTTATTTTKSETTGPSAADLMKQLDEANAARKALEEKAAADLAALREQQAAALKAQQEAAAKAQEEAIAAALKADAERRAKLVGNVVIGTEGDTTRTTTGGTTTDGGTTGGGTATTTGGMTGGMTGTTGGGTSGINTSLTALDAITKRDPIRYDPFGLTSRTGSQVGSISAIPATMATAIQAARPLAPITFGSITRPRTTAPGSSGSAMPSMQNQGPSQFQGSPNQQATAVPSIVDYTSRGIGTATQNLAMPNMGAFGPIGTATQNLQPPSSSFFALSQPSQGGFTPGTVSIGSPYTPLYAAAPTFDALNASPNLTPTMLGGQQNAGIMTDRLGNRIYAPGTPPPGFAKGGGIDVAALLSQNAETLSDEEEEQPTNTDPVGTAQKYLQALSDAGQSRSPVQQSIKRARVSTGGGAQGVKGMTLDYESLTKGEMGGKAPKARETDSARAQLEELARQYQLKLNAARNKARGLSADTFGAPTLEGPSLTKASLAKKRFAKGGEAKKPEAEESEPSLFGVSSYATRAAERMFPGQMGQDDQRDAARHMLAAAMVARKTNPAVAEFLGKAHERMSNPESFFSMLGIGKPRSDYEMDVHNNRLGAELAARTKSQAELEKLVRAMALQSQNKQVEGKPWTMSREQMEARKDKGMTPPPEYAHGGAVHRAEGSPEEGELSDAEREAASRPAFVTPKSGKGRKEGPISKALKSGDAYVNMAKGVTELPYDLVGAPVDLATMVMRPFGYNVDKPVMGSDWIKSKMTGAGVRPEPPADPTQRGFFTAGELLSNLTNPAGVTRAGVKGAEKAGKAATAVAKDFQEYNRQLTVPGASYAVRQTNPQFIPNKVLEGTLERSMPPNVAGQPPESRLQELRMIFGQEAVDTGQGLAPEVAERVLRERDRLVQEAALGKWVNTTLRKYITRDMATPNDPVREMAEQGVMAKAYEVPESYREMAIRKREDAGMAPEGLARSEAARMWEDLADVSFRSTPAGFFLDAATEGSILANNPWLARLDPNTPITRVGTRMAGEPQDTFQHIVDVLKSDMEAGKIRPESLNKMSMADAVKRAHDYNLEKAKIAADARKAAMADRPVYRKYDNDYQWIQLTKPGDFAAESDAMGHSVRGYEPVQNSPDWVEASGTGGMTQYGVGGWEGIKSGKAKIYSLRDTGGDPHGTIEVMSMPVASPAKFRERGINFAEASEAAKRSIGIDPATEAQYVRSLPVEQREQLQKAFDDALVKEFAARTGEMPMENHILQIKGKSNDALVKKYQKYAQDFIFNGKWDSVADLGNAGLHQTPQGYMTSEQMIDLFESLPDNARKTGFVQERIKWLRNNSEPNHDYYDSYLYAKQTF